MKGKKSIGIREGWGEVAINALRDEEEISKYESEFDKLLKKCAEERRGKDKEE